MAYHLLLIFILYALFYDYKTGFKDEKCTNAIFFAIWVIFSIEFYTTTDYTVYYESFRKQDFQEHWEPLYRFIVTIFQPFGFVSMNSCIAAFEMFTLCVFYKKTVSPEYRWIGILIIVLDCTSGLFLLMNLKRQFFAMMVSLWIVYFLLYYEKKQKYLFAVITFLCAINIHSAAFVSVVYFIIPLLKFKLNKYAIVSLIIIFFFSLSFRLSEYMNQMYVLLGATGSDENYYQSYLEQQEEYESFKDNTVFLNQFADISKFLLLLFFNKRFDDKIYKLVVLSIVSFALSNVLKGNFFRLNLFFSIFNVFTIPMLVSLIHSYVQYDRQYKYKPIFYLFLAMIIIYPTRQYYNAMSGSKTTFMTDKYQYFYTIFHNNPDKTIHYIIRK